MYIKTNTSIKRFAMHAMGYVLLLTVFGLGMISVCAQVRHERYNTGHAAVPSRDDQERAYTEARRWLAFCAKNKILTWIIGDSLCASLQAPACMFPWSRKMYFAYTCTNMTSAQCFQACKNLNGRLISVVKVQISCPVPENVFEMCVFGMLKNIKRLKAMATNSSPQLSAWCKRRDVLDWFRYPFFQMKDVFLIRA